MIADPENLQVGVWTAGGDVETVDGAAAEKPIAYERERVRMLLVGDDDEDSGSTGSYPFNLNLLAHCL